MSNFIELTVPETKPATEWVNGRALQKVSPKERHGRAQLRLGAALLLWADQTGLGRVRTEWRFGVTPPGEPTRPLVPDVAYLSYKRLAYEDTEPAQIPFMSPDVAIDFPTTTSPATSRRKCAFISRPARASCSSSIR